MSMIRMKIFMLTLFFATSVYAQDSTSAYKNYFGFSGSRVSGVGLTFGTEPTPIINLQFTGGIFRTSSNSFFSYGFELQYNLHNTNGYRIYLGPAMGGFNEGNELGTVRENTTSEFVIGLAMGAATPLSGIFGQRLGASATFYYPTFYKDNSIGVGFGATIHFRF